VINVVIKLFEKLKALKGNLFIVKKDAYKFVFLVSEVFKREIKSLTNELTVTIGNLCGPISLLNETHKGHVSLGYEKKSIIH
jgi:hypothetical protein